MGFVSSQSDPNEISLLHRTVLFIYHTEGKILLIRGVKFVELFLSLSSALKVLSLLLKQLHGGEGEINVKAGVI